MIRCVEGAGTAESGVFDPLLHSNHARRRLHFIGAVQRLRNARAAAGHVEDDQILNAGTSGTPDQGIRRKHIDLWPVPR